MALALKQLEDEPVTSTPKQQKEDLSKLHFRFEENEKITNGFINKVIAKCEQLEKNKKDVGQFFTQCVSAYEEDLSSQKPENTSVNTNAIEQLNKEATDAMNNAAQVAQEVAQNTNQSIRA